MEILHRLLPVCKVLHSAAWRVSSDSVCGGKKSCLAITSCASGATPDDVGATVPYRPACHNHHICRACGVPLGAAGYMPALREFVAHFGHADCLSGSHVRYLETAQGVGFCGEF